MISPTAPDSTLDSILGHTLFSITTMGLWTHPHSVSDLDVESLLALLFFSLPLKPLIIVFCPGLHHDNCPRS